MNLVQYCETHRSPHCKPSKCPDVRLYHWQPLTQHEAKCQGPHCSKTFTAYRSTAKYHAPACRQAAYRVKPRLSR